MSENYDADWARFDGGMLTRSPITFTPIREVGFMFAPEDFAKQRQDLKDIAAECGIETKGLFDE